MPPNNGYKRCTNIWKLCTRPVLAGIVEMPVTQKVQLENTSGTKNSRLDKTCSGALEDTWFDENIWKQRIWEAEWKIDVVQQDYAGLSFKNRAITWTHKCNQICTQCKAETSQLQKSALAFSFRLTVCPAAFRAAAASCRDSINGIVLCFLYPVTLHKKNTLAKFQAVGSRIWWYDTCFILFWSHESHESHDICQLYISAVDILSGSVLSKLREGHRPQTLRVQQHSAEQRVTRHGTSEHSTVQLARCNWHGAIGTVQLRAFDTLLIHLRDTFLGQYFSMLFYAFLCFSMLFYAFVHFKNRLLDSKVNSCQFQPGNVDSNSSRSNPENFWIFW